MSEPEYEHRSFRTISKSFGFSGKAGLKNIQKTIRLFKAAFKIKFCSTCNLSVMILYVELYVDLNVKLLNLFVICFYFQELIYYCTWTLFFFIAGIVAGVKGNRQSAIAAASVSTQKALHNIDWICLLLYSTSQSPTQCILLNCGSIFSVVWNVWIKLLL